MNKKTLIIVLFCSIISVHQIYAQVVTTFAGSNSQGSANGTATVASFAYPSGVAVDGSGNVYVADHNNSLIRKITQSGVVSTLAGSGSTGSADGIGTAATFYWPSGVAVDGSGNVYVADQNNNLIRKITPAGVVTTLAGSGSQGSANGTGAAASFSEPIGVAVDGSGNVYVADYANSLIRKITPAGVVTTFAGSGSQGSADGSGMVASFYGPQGVVVDGSGNVYVGDTDNSLIRKITPAGVVTTLAGSGSQGSTDGTGTAASFTNPGGLAVDGSGNVYVADQSNDLIRKITPAGVVTTLAGSGNQGFANGTGTAASFNGPSGVAIDGLGNLYVADQGNQVIRKITMLTTGVEDLSSVSDMKLYPIPVKQTLIIAVTLESDSDLKLELINMSGIKVASTEADYGSGFHELSLSVATLTTGIYVVNVYSNGQVKSQRVVIER